jgi:hypothetical protein
LMIARSERVADTVRFPRTTFPMVSPQAANGTALGARVLPHPHPVLLPEAGDLGVVGGINGTDHTIKFLASLSVICR